MSIRIFRVDMDDLSKTCYRFLFPAQIIENPAHIVVRICIRWVNSDCLSEPFDRLLFPTRRRQYPPHLVVRICIIWINSYSIPVTLHTSFT